MNVYMRFLINLIESNLKKEDYLCNKPYFDLRKNKKLELEFDDLYIYTILSIQK